LIRLGFVTSNLNKLREAQIVVSRYGIELYPLKVRKVEIQSDSLEEIAIYAAKKAFELARKPLVVEDAGLFIDALRGFPGPYSSYVYKTIGVEGVLKLMKGIENRRARFIAVVALAISSTRIEVFRGVVEGTITDEPRGSGGFGFDPIFVPQGHEKTFAEMSTEEKCMISHRARAFEAMARWIRENVQILKPSTST